MLVEVLSDSARKYDRTDNLWLYRRLPSLRDYLLVDHNEHRFEHYLRNDDGSWTLRDVIPPDVVRLPLGVELAVADVHENLLA